MAAILDFTGGAALQTVSEWPWRRLAGIVLRNILFGGKGGHPMITLDYRVDWGRPRGSEKGLRNF